MAAQPALSSTWGESAGSSVASGEKALPEPGSPLATAAEDHAPLLPGDHRQGSLSTTSSVGAPPPSLIAAHRSKTYAAVATAFTLEKADENVLPSTFDKLGAALQATPAQLGYVTLSRQLSMALLSPAVGLLGHQGDRRLIVAAGCALWGLSTCLMVYANSVAEAAMLCGVNGVGIALVMPAGQSLIADYYSDSQRGRAYGIINAVQAFGAMLGVVLATNLSGYTVHGVEGWRVAWLLMGLLGLLVGAGFLAVARDPWFPAQKSAGHGRLASQLPRLRSAVTAAKDVLLCPSFIIINLQGLLGVIPFNALTFTLLYLKQLGIDNLHASVIAAGFMAGAAVSGVLGGYIGDRAAVAFPNHGRIAVSALSTLSAVPW